MQGLLVVCIYDIYAIWRSGSYLYNHALKQTTIPIPLPKKLLIRPQMRVWSASFKIVQINMPLIVRFKFEKIGKMSTVVTRY